jgi:heat shock protein HslJ
MNDSDSRALPPHPTSLCVRYRPLLALLRTDALSPREAATLTEHLSGCPWCQRELATYDALDAAARQHLSTVTFTPLTLEDIMQTTETPTQAPTAANAAPAPTDGKARRIAGVRPSGRPPISALGPLAAVMALILLAGLIFTTHGLGLTPGSGIGNGTPIPTATPPTVSQQTAALAQTTWMLRRLFVDGHEHAIVAFHAPTLRFQPQDDRSGKVAGSSGCNSYSGTYTLAGTTLHISNMGTTLVRCSSSDITDQEHAYQQALSRIEQFQLDGDSLMLASGDRYVQVDFHSIHTAALAQSTWTLTQLVVDGHEQPLAPSQAPTLHFQPQDDRSGRFEGGSGCNTYFGSYTLADTTLHMDLSGTTNMACTPDVTDQESAYLSALPRVERFLVEGDTLMLASGDGSVQFTFHVTH